MSDSEKKKDTAASAAKHMHTIKVEDLIVHKYAEHDALFTKAAKVALELIHSELREGEGVRSPAKGVFQLFFPKLKPDAGSLRASVIAERVARELRDINPTLQALNRDAEGSSSTSASVRARDIGRPATVRRSAPTPTDEALAAAHREAATRAVAMMAEATGADELKLTQHEQTVLASVKVMFRPVWHTKNNLITGYYCELTREGKQVSMFDLSALMDSNSRDIVAAKADVAIYQQAAQAMMYLLKQGLKALLIVPVHFSTVDRLRYIRPLLEAGGGVPDDARNLLVFELRELPPDLSRFRLRDPVNYLRGRSRALLARTGFEQANLSLYQELGFHGICADLEDYELDEPSLMKNFEKLAESAEVSKLQSFVHGLSSKSLVVGAMGAGIRYMDGSALAPAVDHPKHIRPYEIDMLYER